MAGNPTIFSADSIAADSLWTDHKSLLYDLFIARNLKLGEVKNIMERDHGFPEFKQSIYETRLRDTLGLRKNLTGDDWNAIDTVLLGREQCKKHSIVLQDGRPLKKQKLSKERRRYRSMPTRGKRPAGRISLPSRIAIRTPSPAPRSPAARSSHEADITLSLSTHPQGMQLDERSGPIANATAKLSSLYRQYGAILQYLPSLQLETKLVELFSRVSIESLKPMEQSAINFLSNAAHSQLWGNNLSITHVSETSAMPRKLAIALSRIANGFHSSEQDMSTLRQWMISLPPYYVRVFFKSGLPILKPIWESLVSVPDHTNWLIWFARAPSGSQEDRALFRSLIEAGLQVNDLIDRDSSKCIDTAIHFHCEDLIKPLIEYGVRIDGRSPCSHQGNPDGSALLRCAVMASRPAALRTLIKARANIESRYDNCCTALGSLIHVLNIRAAAQGDYECLEVLLAAGARADSRFLPNKIPTILDMAFLTTRYAFGTLLQHDRALGSSTTLHGTLRAAEHGLASLQAYLLGRFGWTSGEERQQILEYALVSSISNPEISNVLLSLNINVNAFVDLVQLKVSTGPRISIHSPLSAAVSLAVKTGLDNMAERIISRLVNNGATITPTILASSITTSGVELLQFLDSRVNSVETIGSLALGRAICLGNKEAVEFLLSRRVSINSTLKIPAQQHDTSCLVLQLALGGLNKHYYGLPDSYLFEDPSWYSPASLDMVEYILDRGADINASCPTSHISTLHYILDRFTSCHNTIERFEVCLRHTVSSTVQKYWIDLMHCCVTFIAYQHPNGFNCRSSTRIWMVLCRHVTHQSCIAAVTMFILAGASPDITSSALASVQHVNPDIVAPPITGDSGTLNSSHSNSYLYGFSPLRASVFRGDVGLVMQLLQRGAEVNESPTALSFSYYNRGSSYGYKLTTLQIAIWASWGGDCFGEDEDEGDCSDEDDDEGQDQDQDEPSRHIGTDKWLEIAQHLLEKGARVNASGGDGGLTALQLAAGSGDVRCCLFLISHGASLNDSSCTLAGITPEPFWENRKMGDIIYPLDWAAWFGRLDVVQLLMSLNAESVYQQLTRYDGAVQMAKRRGHTGVVELILQRVNGISLSEWEARFRDPGILGIGSIVEGWAFKRY